MPPAPPSSAPADASFPGAYKTRPELFDEWFQPDGQPRPQVASLVRSFEQMGADGMRDRRRTARQILAENGVSYNVYADGRADARAWELDLLPAILPPSDWDILQSGLRQRTRLLNLVLADLYGAQTLLKEGLLPPGLIHANPGFLRPCHGLTLPRATHLSHHAVELARDPGGAWWALADRTQAPSGTGYALENRIVLSRVLPDEFREANVRRLASFFVAWREGLRSLAPGNADSPSIVLLTPGPFNETYFEQAYLARYMGFPLVQGGDLAVRDRRVYLKTLEGLQPVDVILRRVDDTFCDPLELNAGSFLGVAGLLDAVRAGNVAIANSLGFGAVESPALLAFLPARCRHLLGEDLLIPNAATWWCGREAEREYVLEHLDTLVIKPAFVGRRGSVFGARLDEKALAEWRGRIRTNPHAWVGQQPIALSRAPVWNEGAPESRAMLLRGYVCAGPGDYHVMAGGLTRMAASPDSLIVSSRSGGGSKDTWVTSPEPVSGPSLLDPRGRPVQASRMGVRVTSRVVEDLYWLGRYAERLEESARFLRLLFHRTSGEAMAMGGAELPPLAKWMARRGMIEEERVEAFATTPSVRAEVLRRQVFDPQFTGSIHDLLTRVRHLTFGLRDRLSSDTWLILNSLQADFPAKPTPSWRAGITLPLRRVILDLAAFSGMELENMTRGYAWRFLELGRRLERAALVTSAIQAVTEIDPASEDLLGALLELSDSSITYRRRYFSSPELPSTLDLLLREPANPRSIAFQVDTIAAHLADLPGLPPDSAERAMSDDLTRRVRETPWVAAGGSARHGGPAALLQALAGLGDAFARLSDLLTTRYFSHAVARSN